MSFLSSVGSTTVSSNATGQELMNDVSIANGPEDSISDLSFSKQSNHLAVASWDKKVRIYEIDPSSGQNQGRALYEHDGPVLSAKWSTDGTKVVSGGADKQVKIFDLQSQQAQQIGVHDEAVKCVLYVQCGPSNTQTVVSGSWDKTVKYWDMRSPQPIATVQMPERVYAMDYSEKLLVAATGRTINIINLDNPQQIYKTKDSPLKYQTRTVTCFNESDGYAIGSIEGRCSIQYVEEADTSKAFSFKCHRVAKPSNGSLAYPVNAISFHPVFGTFSTAGSDGTFCFWDKGARQKLKAFPNVGGTISATAFNSNGTIFAYAVSYDWSQGFQANKPGLPNVIKLHATQEEEVKQKKPPVSTKRT